MATNYVILVKTDSASCRRRASERWP